LGERLALVWRLHHWQQKSSPLLKLKRIFCQPSLLILHQIHKLMSQHPLPIFRLTSQLLISLQNWMSKMLICRLTSSSNQPSTLENNPGVRCSSSLISLPHRIPV
jgi:hypothetical protein